MQTTLIKSEELDTSKNHKSLPAWVMELVYEQNMTESNDMNNKVIQRVRFKKLFDEEFDSGENSIIEISSDEE
jgi:hypothetical protein